MKVTIIKNNDGDVFTRITRGSRTVRYDRFVKSTLSFTSAYTTHSAVIVCDDKTVAYYSDDLADVKSFASDIINNNIVVSVTINNVDVLNNNAVVDTKVIDSVYTLSLNVNGDYLGPMFDTIEKCVKWAFTNKIDTSDFEIVEGTYDEFKDEFNAEEYYVIDYIEYKDYLVSDDEILEYITETDLNKLMHGETTEAEIKKNLFKYDDRPDIVSSYPENILNILQDNDDTSELETTVVEMPVACDCDNCPLTESCLHSNNFRRLPTEQGGLGLCHVLTGDFKEELELFSVTKEGLKMVLAAAENESTVSAENNETTENNESTVSAENNETTENNESTVSAENNETTENLEGFKMEVLKQLRNHEEVLDLLVSMLRDFDKNRCDYQRDIYLYIDDYGKGTIDYFNNVGGNSWLDDKHYLLTTVKSNIDCDIDAIFNYDVEQLCDTINKTVSDVKQEIYDNDNNNLYYDVEDVEDIDIFSYVCAKYDDIIDTVVDEYIDNSDQYCYMAENILDKFYDDTVICGLTEDTENVETEHEVSEQEEAEVFDSYEWYTNRDFIAKIFDDIDNLGHEYHEKLVEILWNNIYFYSFEDYDEFGDADNIQDVNIARGLAIEAAEGHIYTNNVRHSVDLDDNYSTNAVLEVIDQLITEYVYDDCHIAINLIDDVLTYSLEYCDTDKAFLLNHVLYPSNDNISKITKSIICTVNNILNYGVKLNAYEVLHLLEFNVLLTGDKELADYIANLKTIYFVNILHRYDDVLEAIIDAQMILVDHIKGYNRVANILSILYVLIEFFRGVENE